MQPFNYSIDVPNPTQGFLQGIQTADALKQRDIETQQKQIAFQQQQEMRQDLSALYSKPNPSTQDYIRIATRYPELGKNFKDLLGNLSEEQRQNKIGTMSQVLAALQSGSSDVAADLIKNTAEAQRNSGDEAGAKAADALAEVARTNPKVAINSVSTLLAATMGPEKFDSAFKTLFTTASDIEKTGIETQKLGADISNIQSQISERANRLNLDKDKLQSETELKLYELDQKKNPAFKLDASAEKIINESAANSVVASQAAGSMRDLASRLEKSGGGYGSFSTAAEWLKNSTGNQDAMSDLRREYLRVRNSQVMSMLPPGSASDKDIAFAVSGFPAENADTASLARFLRGLSKIQEYAAVSENMKSEWVNEVGNLGKPRKDVEIDGVKVPAGMPFSQFVAKNIANKMKSNLQENSRSVVQQRGYMKYAQPAAEQPSPTTTGASGAY